MGTKLAVAGITVATNTLLAVGAGMILGIGGAAGVRYLRSPKKVVVEKTEHPVGR